jgi:hypothetical protein
MVAVTLNGQPGIPLPDGDLLRGEASEDRGALVLWREDPAGERRWESGPLPVEPDPQHRHTTSASADYVALPWPAADVVAVLGHPAALLLDATTGKVRERFPAHFIDKASLDVADLRLVGTGDRLLISSTRLVWLVATDLQPVERIEPVGPLAAPPRVDNHTIRFDVYNITDNGDVIEETLQF